MANTGMDMPTDSPRTALTELLPLAAKIAREFGNIPGFPGG
jgi:hypothetical protein